MSAPIRILRNLLVTAGAFALLSPFCLADGISATATYTSSQVSPGMYQYNLILDNTGTTTIGTFWFSWVPGAGFLSAIPTSVASPSGWTEKLTAGNAAIQWTTGTPLAIGEMLSGFSFDSTETPDQLLLDFPGTGTGLGAGDPVTTSFVYISTPLGDPGYQFTAQPAVVATTPEPASLALTLTGIVAALFFWRARRRGDLAV